MNNVETLCNIPHIINNGADWFKSLSLCKDSGTKIYGVSGKVKNPELGNYLWVHPCEKSWKFTRVVCGKV